MLAEVAEIPWSVLPTINWNPKKDFRLPALLSQGGAFFSKGIGEPFVFSLLAVFTSPPLTSHVKARLEEILAPTAHEDAGVERFAPLMMGGVSWQDDSSTFCFWRVNF